MQRGAEPALCPSLKLAFPQEVPTGSRCTPSPCPWLALSQWSSGGCTRSCPRKQNPSLRLSRSQRHQLLCCHSGFYSARCAVCANRILSAIPWVTVVLPSMTSTAGVECPHPLNFCGLFRYNFCFFCFMAQELQSPNVPVWLQHMNYSLF